LRLADASGVFALAYVPRRFWGVGGGFVSSWQ
jgi:hypothetical protein